MKEMTIMKHEHQLDEHPDALPASADTTFGDLGESPRESGQETDWDNWKSVRDVGDGA